LCHHHHQQQQYCASNKVAIASQSSAANSHFLANLPEERLRTENSVTSWRDFLASRAPAVTAEEESTQPHHESHILGGSKSPLPKPGKQNTSGNTTNNPTDDKSNLLITSMLAESDVRWQQATLRLLCQSFASLGVEWDSVFDAFDGNRDGHVSVHEFLIVVRQVLRSAHRNHELSPPTRRQEGMLWDCLSPLGQSSLPREKFVNAFKRVSRALLRSTARRPQPSTKETEDHQVDEQQESQLGTCQTGTTASSPPRNVYVDDGCDYDQEHHTENTRYNNESELLNCMGGNSMLVGHDGDNDFNEFFAPVGIDRHSPDNRTHVVMGEHSGNTPRLQVINSHSGEQPDVNNLDNDFGAGCGRARFVECSAGAVEADAHGLTVDLNELQNPDVVLSGLPATDTLRWRAFCDAVEGVHSRAKNTRHGRYLSTTYVYACNSFLLLFTKSNSCQRTSSSIYLSTYQPSSFHGNHVCPSNAIQCSLVVVPLKSIVGNCYSFCARRL
jgi:hypothetical protein